VNYRHAFHAGNFADVHKHAVLTAVICSLAEKPRALSYVETHAGAGFYLLESPEAKRSREARSGLGRLSGVAPDNLSLARYLALVAALPENAQALTACPGSPLVAAGLLRDDDRLLLCELEDGEAVALKRLFRHDDRVAVHHRDGWEAVGALLPPEPRRGLLLVDPPYEAAEDFRLVAAALRQARERWPTGVLAAWYPIRDRRELTPFYREIGAVSGPVLRAELAVRPDDNQAGLNGSGMVIVAPPFGIEGELRGLQGELARLLCPQGAPRDSVDIL